MEKQEEKKRIQERLVKMGLWDPSKKPKSKNIPDASFADSEM